MAAAISYYVLFSLFPLLIFSVGILGVLLQDSKLQQDLVNLVLDYIPLSEDKGRNDLTNTVRGVAGVGSGALGLLGLVGMAWSGSNMFGVIRRSLNMAFDLDVHRPILWQKLLDLGMVVAFTPFFMASVAATAFLRVAQKASADVPVAGPLADDVGSLWAVASAVVPVIISFFAFFFLYWIVPATTVRRRDAWLGALIAALLFEALKVGFGLYLENFSNYDVVFGSLGAVVAFLFWVYLAGNVLLLGAEIVSEYPRVMRGDYDEIHLRPAPGSGKPFRTRVWLALRKLVTHEEPVERSR